PRPLVLRQAPFLSRWPTSRRGCTARLPPPGPRPCDTTPALAHRPAKLPVRWRTSRRVCIALLHPHALLRAGGRAWSLLLARIAIGLRPASVRRRPARRDPPMFHTRRPLAKCVS